jgi:hypothetical protein
MPDMINRRTIGSFTTLCFMSMATMLHAQQADNDYDASASGSFIDQSKWSGAGGGPAGWPGGTDVGGSIEFNLNGGTDIIINGIDLDYTGITDLITTDNGLFSQLRLEGSGSLNFSSPTGTVTITPGSGLTLAVDTVFDGDVVIDTTKITNAALESVSIEEMMTLTSPGARLTIYGSARVTFEQGSVLDMLNGTIVVGSQTEATAGILQILDDDTLANPVNLEFFSPVTGTGTQSSATLGDATVSDQAFSIGTLSGLGTLQTQSASLTLENGSSSIYSYLPGTEEYEINPQDFLALPQFNGSMTIDGDLFLNGANTLLWLDPTEDTFVGPSTVSGDIQISGGASLLLGDNIFAPTGLPTLTNLNLFLVDGLFGGNAQIQLNGDFGAGPNLTLNSGWLVGGDFFTGEGSLDFNSGFSFGDTVFDQDMGIWITYDPETGRPSDEAYIEVSGTSIISFLIDPNAAINLHILPSTDAQGNQYFQWISPNDEFFILNNTNNDPFSNQFRYGPGGSWNLTSNMSWGVTRTAVFTTATETPNSFGGFDQLFMTLEADYVAPSGAFSGIGQTIQSSIPEAENDPSGEASQLLVYLDAIAVTNASYQNALSGMMPNSQFTADRVTADNMYSNVTMRNIRELAIGTRGPGMIRDGQLQNPILLAALQEEDALEAANNQPDLMAPTEIIVQTSKQNKKNDDVFQALFAEGYGRWNDMDAVGLIPGYSARSVGVSGGWGVGLADGLTAGISVGWENTTATMKDNFGDITVDSFRGTPFVSWSDSDGKIERYVMFGVGGGYNTSNGSQNQKAGPLSTEYNFDMTGWEVDIEAATGTRVPLSENFALQPEASIRYTILNYSGTNTDKTTNLETDYNGDDFQFVTGRLGFGMEWLLDPFSRFTTSLGWQGQYLDYGSAEFALPGAIGMTSQDGGSGSVNQFYVGTQLLFNPNWNTAISIGYEGAFGDGASNAFTGSLILRF